MDTRKRKRKEEEGGHRTSVEKDPQTCLFVWSVLILSLVKLSKIVLRILAIENQAAENPGNTFCYNFRKAGTKDITDLSVFSERLKNIPLVSN